VRVLCSQKAIEMAITKEVSAPGIRESKCCTIKAGLMHKWGGVLSNLHVQRRSKSLSGKDFWHRGKRRRGAGVLRSWFQRLFVQAWGKINGAM
jgi:hypothetical protein